MLNRQDGGKVNMSIKQILTDDHVIASKLDKQLDRKCSSSNGSNKCNIQKAL